MFGRNMVICGTKVMSSSMTTITAYSGSMFTEVFSLMLTMYFYRKVDRNVIRTL